MGTPVGRLGDEHAAGGWGFEPYSVVVAGCLLVGSVVSVALVGDDHPIPTVLTLLAALAIAATGRVLLGHPRGRRTGALLMTAGALWPSTLWGMADSGPGPWLSWTLGGIAWTLLAVAIISYPAEVPWGRSGRAFVAATVVVLVVLNVVQATVSEPQWNGLAAAAWWPHVTVPRGWHTVVVVVYGVGCLGLATAAVVLFGQRMRRASGIDRAALVPALAGTGLAGTVGALSSGGQLVVTSDGTWGVMVLVQSVALLSIPFSVALTALRTRLANAGIAETVGRLTRPATPESVQAAVRALLRDPSATVLFWSPERAGYIDGDGDPAEPPLDVSHLVVDVRAGSGARLAVVAVDRRLRHHAGLVHSTVAAVGLALENAWLQAQLYAQLGEVRASRARIMDVQMSERRQLGRNLHDGAQQNLLALSMRLEAVRTSTSDESTRQQVTVIKEQLRSALADIRHLARGLHPAVLTQAGLSAAVEEMVEGWPVTVVVDLPPERLDPLVESAAYFVVSEALANVDKHARAGAVSVWGRLVDGDFILCVSDDGLGGADARGSGLSGLADRAGALGGTLAVTSPPGGGTRIDVRIPVL